MKKNNFTDALPFWMSLTILGVVLFSAYMGGWWLILIPAYTWWFLAIVDHFEGMELSNKDPNTPDSELFWYRLITIIWFPLECVLIFGAIAYVSWTDNLQGAEAWALLFGIGVVSGSVGIVYAHELMHQKPKYERHMGDGLMCLTLYGHFRSEHLLVHHRYVATPRDPVTARYNEGFHRYFPRVLISCLKSSWAAEKAMLARKGLPVYHRSNPFWKYAILQLSFLVLSFVIGGWFGVALFCVQAFTAIWQLELVNYVEHYGLTRRHLGDGKYEHVKPHHSWNAAYKVSNYFLINLQRHSDHHYKPDRRFPLLQTYDADQAPQLPASYSWMTIAAMVPPVWKKIMNPRVKAWRQQHYPDVEDWHPYNKALNPQPK